MDQTPGTTADPTVAVAELDRQVMAAAEGLIEIITRYDGQLSELMAQLDATQALAAGTAARLQLATERIEQLEARLAAAGSKDGDGGE